MDDAEGGVGGIVISAVEAGHRVVDVVAVSDVATWKPTMRREAQCKADQLALAKRFGYELKRKLAAIANKVQPDIAFVQNTDDHWPDHVASGIAGKDAVLFPHGLTANKEAKRCPLVFAYCSGANQTFKFEPDYYFDTTSVMSRYMELIAGFDVCLNGMPLTEQLEYEARNLKTNEVLRMSGHGWECHAECVRWAAQSGTNAKYALGLKMLWGPRDGRPL